MKISLIFLALVVLVSGCAGLESLTGSPSTTISTLPPLPTINAPVGNVGGGPAATPEATTTTLQAATTTQNTCPLPHGTGNYISGLCAVVSCNSDYYNCDGNSVNGCEATSPCATTTTSTESTTTSTNATTTTVAQTTTTAAPVTTAAATTTNAAPTTAAPTTTIPTTTTSSTTTTTQPPAPDLTITYNGKANAGTTVRIDFTLNNIGTDIAVNNAIINWVSAVPTGGGAAVTCYASPPGNIAAGGTHAENCFLVVDSLGSYTVTITADNTNKVSESNENNNVATTTITIS